MECTPIPFYLILRKPQRPIDRLRRYLVPAKWRQMSSWRRKLGFACAVVGWPAIVAWRAGMQTRQHGRGVQRETGRPPWRQFLDQWWLACWYGLAPHAYYMYGLFLAERRTSAVDYFHNQELNSVAKALNRRPDNSILHDKIRFARFCTDRGLSTVPVLTVFEDRQVTGGEVTTAAALPTVDLFAKPTDAGQGRGVRAWRCLGPDRYQAGDGQEQTAEQVFATLLNESRSYLLQRRIQAHPALRRVTTGGLPTVRVITGRQVSGSVDVLFAIFKMPTKQGLADNFAAGGIACPVNQDDGRLGTAAGKGPIIQRLTHHPDTGHPITGVTLPHWQQARQLCITAHEQLSDFVFLGWDVALTEDGPTLVECNAFFCTQLIQKGMDRPLGGSSFNDLCLEHFQAGKSPSR